MMKEFLKRKNIEISAKRYGIDALGAMAQGLFCSLLIGTIIKTLGQQLSISYLVDIGTYAMAVAGPAMAVAIGQCNATKLLFPVSHCNNVVVGTQSLTLSKLMDEAVELLRTML